MAQAVAMKILVKMKVFGNNLIKRNHMKKCTLMILTATLSLAACQEVETALVNETVLSAIIEQDEITRTEMDENNNVLWNENDQIIAFLKTSYGHKYQVKPSFVGKSYADFSMVSSSSGNDLSAGNEWEHNVAYYPYSDAIECLKSGDHYVLDVVLPSEQTYVPESFGNGSMAMVAVSEGNNITFKNVLGGIKLQFKGTQKVKSITLQGKNNEKLSGSATVTAYTNDTKPAITMDSDAFTSVTLNCDSEVQLSESTATDFIITLPPVLFSQGFTVIVTDNSGQTYTIETTKANTVLRSSLLIMPPVKLVDSGSEEPDGSEATVAVGKITLNKTALTLPTNISYTLTARITPIDASDQTVTWSSSNASVVTVDQSGIITTLSSGTVDITAEAGGVIESCTITVIAPTTKELIEYKDGDINYGYGVVLGNVIWAPVNCGYESATSNSKGYTYGKIYQWGRKQGLGLYQSEDASVPELIEGPISIINAYNDTYANVFFTAHESPLDWLSPQNDKLWNSGTDEDPVKTEFDPCPEGWRVPTYLEIKELIKHRSDWTSKNGQNGFYFSGLYTYLDNVPRVFLPAAGFRYGRGNMGYSRQYEGGGYWSSKPFDSGAYACYFLRSWVELSDYGDSRATAYSIRCVQE